MEKQKVFFEQFLSICSRPRLLSYFNQKICQDELDVLAAYSWNIQLSQAFYPGLQTLEITLRNALHEAIGTLLKSDNWLESSFLHTREQNAIQRAKNNLIKKQKYINSDRIVAELHLGFWTSLFDVRYEHQQLLWPKLLAEVFPFIPKKYRTRSYLLKNLNQMRHLRNRIFHYEPIWRLNDLVEQHQILLNLLAWLSPLAQQHAKMLDQFNEIYQKGLSKNKELLQRAIYNAEQIELTTTN